MEIPQTTILLIEDDEEDYFLLKKVLAKITHAQYKLTWESRYAIGLELMLAEQHDLCLLDYRLGARNGIDLIREARSKGYARPIILLTGANESEIDIMALQAGADDYIPKEHVQADLLGRSIRYAIERKKAEREREILLSEQIASQELEKKRNEFISMVVHELRTPLTSLKAHAQLLRKRFLLLGDEAVIHTTTRMNAQINKLTDLITDFQDVTRIEGERLQFRKSYFTFDGLVDELIEEIQPITEKHQLIREGVTNKTIWGDRSRTGQVITNLLMNAIKYAPDTKRIIIKTQAADDTVTLSVQDFGPGIPPALQAKIFDPFYRLDDAKQNAISGLGLGLYISAEMIKRQDGRLWVESEQGKGSTFSFTLPVAGEHAPEKETAV
jgi:signal transduction histidine kinase